MQFGQMWDDTYPDRAPIRLEYTLEEIRRHQADFILLQEVEQTPPGGVQLQSLPLNYTRLKAELASGHGAGFPTRRRTRVSCRLAWASRSFP